MYPKISQVVQMIIVQENGEPTPAYTSHVTDIQEHSIWLEIPFVRGSASLVRMHEGQEVSISYQGLNMATCSFDTYVQRLKRDHVHIAALHKPALEEIKQIQRRNFLRVPAEVEAAIRLKDGSSVVVRTEDISGGGFSFNCQEHIPILTDQLVHCWLALPFRNGTMDHVSFFGEIVRTKKEVGKKQQWVSLKINDITDAERQKIIRYCFERQIDLKK